MHPLTIPPCIAILHIPYLTSVWRILAPSSSAVACWMTHIHPHRYFCPCPNPIYLHQPHSHNSLIPPFPTSFSFPLTHIQLLQEGTVPVITPSHIAQFLPDFPVNTHPTWIRSVSSCGDALHDEEQYFSGVAVTGALYERVSSHTRHELTFVPSHRTSPYLR